MTSQLEDKYRVPYDTWKSLPSPASNTQMLKTLQPTIDGAIQTHVGQTNPMLVSRARKMTLDGLRTYDPSIGRLETHLYNHLQGLKRVNRQQTQILKVPERVQLDRGKLAGFKRELESELGREPTDFELSEFAQIPVRRIEHVRKFNPAIAEGSLIDPSGQGYSGSVRTPEMDGRMAWHQLVYDELDPYHQKIMELSLGMNGRRRPLSNQEIARRMGRSPGAISQAKLRIQRRLDEEDMLSPFGG